MIWVGLALAITAASTWLFVLPAEVNGHTTNPYKGVVLYLILPAVLFGGLALVVLGGGLISASIPPVAGSGVGTDGWQMLLRSPTIPLDPAVQKPSRPPMSPIPGTWQIPPDGAAGCAGT